MARPPAYRHRFSPLGIRLVAATFLFIVGIEGVLLGFSYLKKQEELQEWDRRAVEVVRAQTGVELKTVFGKTFLDDHLQEYVRNIIYLTGLICVVVCFGVLAVFYWIAGKPLLNLLRSVQGSHGGKLVRYEGDIPDNEIGELIRNREAFLVEIEGYRRDAESVIGDMKDQLIHSGKLSAIGEFTATIAHDLKNPIAIIISYTERLRMLLEREIQDPQKILSSVGKIDFASKRLLKLVNRMNQFSRQETEMVEGVVLAEVIQNSLVLLESKIKNLGIILSDQTPECRQTVWGNAGELEQVFMNLISNACDALEGSSRREIYISIEKSDGRVQVRLADTGPGIPDEVISQIFNPFFTTKGAGRGTGLGLSICKRIITGHLGELDCRVVPGRGTEFYVVLHHHRPASMDRAA